MYRCQGDNEKLLISVRPYKTIVHCLGPEYPLIDHGRCHDVVDRMPAIDRRFNYTHHLGTEVHPRYLPAIIVPREGLRYSERMYKTHQYPPSKVAYTTLAFSHWYLPSNR